MLKKLKSKGRRNKDIILYRFDLHNLNVQSNCKECCYRKSCTDITFFGISLKTLCKQLNNPEKPNLIYCSLRALEAMSMYISL